MHREREASVRPLDTMLIGTSYSPYTGNGRRDAGKCGPRLTASWPLGDDRGWRSLQVPSWPHLIRWTALTVVSDRLSEEFRAKSRPVDACGTG